MRQSSRAAVVPTAATELFQFLRDGRPRTRAALAAETGLARSTVAARVEELMALGLVTPVADGSSTGGRPPSRFALDPDARTVVGVDIGASHVTVALANLAGELSAVRNWAQDVDEGPEAVLTRVVAAVRELLDSTGLPANRLVALGVGVPGPVEHLSGRPWNPPIMPGWDRFDIPGWLQRYLDVPVLVDNDVNIMALGERAVASPREDHLIFVKIATGIGVGIISGGRLLRGAQGSAGDIGHVKVTNADPVPCRCGNRGCLEALASGSAIAAALRSAGREVSGIEGLVELVRAGDVQAIEAVRGAGRQIGEVLTSCVSLLNPSVIVLGGTMGQVGEHLLAGVRELIYTQSTPLATEKLIIGQSAAGDRAAVIGAAILAIDHVLSPSGILEMAARRDS